jgi:pyridoxamine 5'-phosphate oxidase
VGTPAREPLTRSEYDRATLSEEDLAPTWHEQLALWVNEAVAAEVAEPAAMTLATATADGAPGARTVLLRGVSVRGLVFHTNHESRKGRELDENPRAAAVLAWVSLQRQVVADGVVERLPEDESDAYWTGRPHKSRIGALASPQSRVVATRAELEDRFAELSEQYPEGSDIPRPEWWGGFRLVPDRVEFWNGRRDRLHDRLRFRHTAGEWVVERLAP